MKRILFVCLLTVSLIGNLLLGWSVFYHGDLNQNEKVDYESSIQSIHDAQELIHAARSTNGVQQTRQLFQAYNLLITAQLLMTSYEKPFQRNGIPVSNLKTLLQTEASELRLLLGNDIDGRKADVNQLIHVEKNLSFISSILPKTYLGMSHGMKDSFSKLHHQE